MVYKYTKLDIHIFLRFIWSFVSAKGLKEISAQRTGHITAGAEPSVKTGREELFLQGILPQFD